MANIHVILVGGDSSERSSVRFTGIVIITEYSVLFTA